MGGKSWNWYVCKLDWAIELDCQDLCDRGYTIKKYNSTIGPPIEFVIGEGDNLDLGNLSKVRVHNVTGGSKSLQEVLAGEAAEVQTGEIGRGTRPEKEAKAEGRLEERRLGNMQIF